MGGIIHAAGVLEDRLAQNLDRSHLQAALGPKVDGALNLHEACTDRTIRHFVLFSSVASLLGSPGQANYGAGNAFLDSLAQFRCARGLAALSLQWGPWSEVGMAARAGTSEVRF